MVFTTNIQTDVDVSVTFYNLCYRGGGVKTVIFHNKLLQKFALFLKEASIF